MHIEIARNRSILANPNETAEQKTAARLALESIAADPKDRRSLDAALTLREFGFTGNPSEEDLHTETVHLPAAQHKLPAKTEAELVEIVGKIPTSREELDRAVITLIRALVHEGRTDAEKEKYDRLDAALNSLRPLPYKDPKMLEALRTFGPFAE